MAVARLRKASRRIDFDRRRQVPLRYEACFRTSEVPRISPRTVPRGVDSSLLLPENRCCSGRSRVSFVPTLSWAKLRPTNTVEVSDKLRRFASLAHARRPARTEQALHPNRTRGLAWQAMLWRAACATVPNS